MHTGRRVRLGCYFTPLIQHRQKQGSYCMPVVVDVAVLVLVETGDGGTNAAREFPGGR